MSNKKQIEYIEAKIVKGELKPTASIISLLDSLHENTVKHGLKATPEEVEHLAKSGVSVKNICSLYQKGFEYLTENPELKSAFDRGRAHVASRIRAKLIDAALEEDSMQAAIYLDKLMGGDTEQTTVNLNVSQRPLDSANTEQLLDAIDIHIKDDDNS